MTRLKMTHSKSAARAAAALLFGVLVWGCRSPYVAVEVVNQTGGIARLVEVDYPDASFGTQQIANGATYHYRFKVLGETPGPVKVTYTGSDNRVHTATGPVLKPGEQGELTIQLGPNGSVGWVPHLASTK